VSEGGDAMRQSKFMKTRWMVVSVGLPVPIVGAATGGVGGQEKPVAARMHPTAYDVNREVTMVGQVVRFSASSTLPPLGPHVRLETASGVIDIHLGDTRLLEAHHMVVENGDSLPIIGEEVTLGSAKQFVARIVQKARQAIVVRSAGGFPLSPASPTHKWSTPGGVQ